MINFESQETVILCNPRLQDDQSKRAYDVLSKLEEFPEAVWLSTSGSTAKPGEQCWVALSRGAILASAHAVNQHLGSVSQDVWVNPLPHFHVGGLGIIARAYLSGASTYNFSDKWSARNYVEFLTDHKATLSSLVPTQVYDLVLENLRAPKSLRAIIVGGGSLTPEQYEKAKSLGWPLLPSYGMTECASQIATASFSSPKLNFLPHIEAATDAESRLMIKSPALFTSRVRISPTEHHIENPIKNGWFTTEDTVAIIHGTLEIKGRTADFIKIGGESVNFAALQGIWKVLWPYGNAELIAISDQRLGHAIHLAVEEASHELDVAQKKYSDKVMPYENIRKIHLVPKIPRTSLGKVARAELLRLIAHN